MAEKCTGIWSRLFGHNYVPIYETGFIGTTDPKIIAELNNNTLLQSIEGELTDALFQIQHRKKTYIHSICNRCGNKITRE